MESSGDQKLSKEKFRSKIPVPKKNVKTTRRETLLDLDPNSRNAQRADENDEKRSLRRSRSVSVLDARFVTVHRHEDLPHPFWIFHDGDEKSVLAPTTLPKGGKNVKKSLTRPRSRRVQTSSVSKCLSFAEEPTTEETHQLVSSPTSPKRSCDPACGRVYEIDVFTYLLEKEERMPVPVFLKSLKHRAFVLNWLTNANGATDPAVVQTAAWYLDTILSHRRVETRDLSIVMMACFWIAKKINGRVCTARAIVQRAGVDFHEEHLCSAEKTIMALLKFPCQAVLPQEFLRYLASCCDSGGSQDTLLCATFVCVNAINLNLDMCEEFPSVIAAAAIRTSLLLLENQHLVDKLKGCFVYQAAMLKGDVVEVCVAQIEALRMFFAEQFELTAAQRVLGERQELLASVKRHLNYLYSTGGEGVVRAFLMY